METYGVLFVCTGNICRSPTAEGLFRHAVQQAGLSDGFHIDSAGTHGYHVGDPPDPRAVATARRRGVDLSGLRARRVRDADFHDFDMILAMDRGHFEIMRPMSTQGGRAALSMFLDYFPDAGETDVPDPYYGGTDGFEHVFDLVEKGAAGLLDVIRREQGL